MRMTQRGVPALTYVQRGMMGYLLLCKYTRYYSEFLEYITIRAIFVGVYRVFTSVFMIAYYRLLIFYLFPKIFPYYYIL